MVDEEKRIQDDIRQFYENVRELEDKPELAKLIDLAKRYCEDTKYYLAKKDYVTAFGCINYAHGLIDAFRNFKSEKKLG